MKKLMLTAVICSVVFFGCSKEEEVKEDISPVETPQIIKHMPLAIGNYWVYDTYQIDTLGNESIFSSSDSAYVDRDTLINDKVYYIIEGDFNAKMATGNIIRNESNSILYSDGSIRFTTNNLASIFRRDTTNVGGGNSIHMKIWVNVPTPTILVPAGSFACYDRETEMTPTQIDYPWGTRSQHSYYNKTAGVVLSEFHFYSSPSIFETRLVRFNIN